MGSMSASDAAPLPRLGEVFFDVRGSSRSMRLSWYSDTGVAVFSIWQGGTCTGTFRLPIDDLPRMIEALQRGPRGAGPPAADTTGLIGLPGGGQGPSGDGSDAPFADYATGQHIAPVTGEFRRPELGERDSDPLGSGSYRQQSPDPVYSPPPSPAFSPAPTPARPYREDPLTSPSFRDQARSAGYRDSGDHPYGDDPLGSGSYRQPTYGDDGYLDRRYPPDDGGYQPGYGSGGYGNGDSSGYPAQEGPGVPASQRPGEYPGRRYTDDPFQSNYPDEAPSGSHPYGPFDPPDPEPRSHRGRPSRT
jgi:hypothetical protein